MAAILAYHWPKRQRCKANWPLRVAKSLQRQEYPTMLVASISVAQPVTAGIEPLIAQPNNSFRLIRTQISTTSGRIKPAPFSTTR